MNIREIVVKVTSSCNLNCKYCYIYNKGDNAYISEPSVISEKTVEMLLKKIDSYCKEYKIPEVVIIFHGGEPLILGTRFYKNFITQAELIVKSTKLKYTLQTNGTLLTVKNISELTKLGIQIGVSIDGSERASENRIYRNSNRHSLKDAVNGYKLLLNNQPNAGILCVINTEIEPFEIYEYFKELGSKRYDLLVPETTYSNQDKAVNKLGDWLIKYYNIHKNDTSEVKPTIKIFDIIEDLIYGVETGNEQFGKRYNQAISIKTSGSIEPVDSLKICRNGITFSSLNVHENDIKDIHNNELMVKYYNAHQDSVLCDKCKQCIIGYLCGGSQLAHRYSETNLFDNESAYCNDIIKLFIHIQNWLYNNDPIFKKNGIEPLTKADFGL